MTPVTINKSKEEELVAEVEATYAALDKKEKGEDHE